MRDASVNRVELADDHREEANGRVRLAVVLRLLQVVLVGDLDDLLVEAGFRAEVFELVLVDEVE